MPVATMTASASSLSPDSNRRPCTPPVAEDLLDDRAEPDGDAALLELGLEDGRGRRIELAGQKAVEVFDDDDLGLPAADGPGDLQAEEPSAEDRDALWAPRCSMRSCASSSVLSTKTPFVDAVDRGQDRPGARREEEHVVGPLATRGRLDRPLRRPDPRDLLAERDGRSAAARTTRPGRRRARRRAAARPGTRSGWGADNRGIALRRRSRSRRPRRAPAGSWRPACRPVRCRR